MSANYPSSLPPMSDLALQPTILNSYGGKLHGDFRDSYGARIVDVEFPSVHHAATWADTCEIADSVSFRDKMIGRTLDGTVTVQFVLPDKPSRLRCSMIGHADHWADECLTRKTEH